MSPRRAAKPRPPYRVDGPRLYLRDVRLSDVGPAYLRWMNDPDVTRYLESRFSRHTRASLRAFVSAARKSPSSVFLAIVLKEGGRHVGNLKIGGIDWYHGFGDVGLLLGEKDVWGRGYGTEAIALATRFSFETLQLNHLTAGCYETNEGSARAFLNAGWVEEGRRHAFFRLGDRHVDGLLFGASRDAWRPGPALRPRSSRPR